MNARKPLNRAILNRLPLACIGVLIAVNVTTAQNPATRVYHNKLTPIENPKPLLADYPEFVQPVVESQRFESPMLIDDENAELDVRAWRFSYNARGIIEMPNQLRAKNTAVIMVHPWGIDDSWGWRTPEPAGVADMCTPEKNRLSARHTELVIEPLLKRLRDRVGLVVYSLPQNEKPVHAKLYRSIRKTPTAAEREEGRRELKQLLADFPYRGEPLPDKLNLSRTSTVKDYFQQFPGLDAGPKYEGQGFWDLPIPVIDVITVAPTDVVIYDGEGYPPLRDFLKQNKIEHVLLVGYATDMCFCKTTAGYENLSKDFNVFLVGDATLATFPANNTPKYATNAHISFAALNHLITQTSWIQFRPNAKTAAANSQAEEAAPFHIQAHRGAGAALPENTFESFEWAWKHGVTPESDLRTTMDGTIVCFHDADLKRVPYHIENALKTSSVEKLPLAELQKLDVGSFRAPQFARQHIPTLASIFAEMHGHPERQLYLDIKSVKLDQLEALVREYKVERQIIFTSEHPRLIREWKTLIPESQTLLWNRGTETQVAKKMADLRETKFAEITHLQIHVQVGDLNSDEPFTPGSNFLQKLGKELKSRGIVFQTFSADCKDQKVYEKLLALGVESFATDYPEATLNAVKCFREKIRE